MRLRSAIIGLAICLATGAQAQPFTLAGSGQGFYRLDDAVRAGGAGRVEIVAAPGTYHDCASVDAADFTLRAAQPGTVIFDGQTCEGKAALVLRARVAHVDGIIFQNMRVPDGNGAGIRLEKGALTVTNTWFRDSEDGILTADDPTGTVVVDQSTFSGLGRCDRGLSCAHSIYVGNYGSVTVTRTRFERGNGGHYVKSRAARNEVRNSSFDDSHGHTTNYMIDLCAGSQGIISGNVFVQGKDKENHSAFVTVAAEARDHPSAGLVIRDNSAAQAVGVDWPSVFVADWSHEPLNIGANRLSSRITPFELR